MLPYHHRYPRSTIDRRKDYSWPGDKRLAFWISTAVEVFGFGAGLGVDPVILNAPPSHRNYAWREYGNRVGIWRLFELYDELKLPTSCVINSLVYDEYPEIFERIRKRGDDIIGHGRSNAERQTGMWEPDEKLMIDEVTNAIRKNEGAPPKGWIGPGVSETGVTLDLLKEVGYRYVLDWPCDDQPIWMDTRAGKILSIPYPMELNDIGQNIQRQHNAREFCDMIVDQFDEMVRKSVDQPLVCAISLHSYIAGQPFRLAPLRSALKHIVEHKHRDRVWITRADAISDYCYAMPAGVIG